MDQLGLLFVKVIFGPMVFNLFGPPVFICSVVRFRSSDPVSDTCVQNASSTYFRNGSIIACLRLSGRQQYSATSATAAAAANSEIEMNKLESQNPNSKTT